MQGSFTYMHEVCNITERIREMPACLGMLLVACILDTRLLLRDSDVKARDTCFRQKAAVAWEKTKTFACQRRRNDAQGLRGRDMQQPFSDHV